MSCCFSRYGIENHGQIADEDAAEPGGANFAAVEEHEAILARGFEAAEFVGEIARRNRCRIRAEISSLMTMVWQSRRLMTARRKRSSFGKMIAAHGGEAAVGDGLFPGGDVAIILRVGVLECR